MEANDSEDDIQDMEEEIMWLLDERAGFYEEELSYPVISRILAREQAALDELRKGFKR